MPQSHPLGCQADPWIGQPSGWGFGDAGAADEVVCTDSRVPQGRHDAGFGAGAQAGVVLAVKRVPDALQGLDAPSTSIRQTTETARQINWRAVTKGRG